MRRKLCEALNDLETAERSRLEKQRILFVKQQELIGNLFLTLLSKQQLSLQTISATDLFSCVQRLIY